MKKFFSILSTLIFIFAPSLSIAGPYYNEPYRGEVGLNYHWALSGFGKDEIYNQRLFDSKTSWVREHLSTEVLNVENPEAWFQRYDYVLNQYEGHNTNILAMLAYGFEKNDFSVNDQEKWLKHVERVVYRYQDTVDAWEIWNEPDSPDFLWHNSPQEYLKILIPTAQKIKEIDPDAIIVSAGLASPNIDFARVVLENAHGLIDVFGVHYYYGERYYREGNLNSLEDDAQKLRNLVNEFDPQTPIWVTEFGLSTGSSGITEEKQKQYLQRSIDMLFEKKLAQRVFIYNFRNYDYNTHYENNFGLVDNSLNPRQSWQWYLEIPRGPYDKVRNLAYEQKKALELKKQLDYYFAGGIIPLSSDNWPTIVQAYAYGGYTIKEIVQALRFGGKTVHPKFAAKFWRGSSDYEGYINKKWTGGPITYAYGKARIKIEDEAEKAKELAIALNQKYPDKTFQLSDWSKLVNAYVYGGYPIESIARVYETNWSTVDLEKPYK